MEERYYTAAMLEVELDELEEHYGISSQEFYAAYQDGHVVTGLSGREAFRWADTYCELARLRSALPAEPQPA